MVEEAPLKSQRSALSRGSLHTPHSWLEEQGGWELEIVERDREARGFEVLSKRWIVERTFSWLIRNRRLSKDYERMVQSSETFIKVAMIRLMLRRLARAA